MSEKPVPTITIRVVNREDFVIETSVEGCPFPDYALNMLETALRGIKAAKQDRQAIEFQQKMQAAANVARAMQKRPGLQ